LREGPKKKNSGGGVHIIRGNPNIIKYRFSGNLEKNTGGGGGGGKKKKKRRAKYCDGAVPQNMGAPDR